MKSHGKTVLRDRGILVEKYLFDTLGYSKPGGTQLSFEITKVIGPHPGDRRRRLRAGRTSNGLTAHHPTSSPGS
jgi:hypothetical protein